MMELMKTHLHEFHQKKGYLGNFAGFDMPISYEGIIQEHLTVRNAVGIFDVTHMGRCLVEGQDSSAFLNEIVTQDIYSMSNRQGRYSVMCNEKGGIMDDLVIFRLEDNQFMIVYNASNRVKDFEWMINHAKDFRVGVKDVSNETALFAIQGPKALSTLQSLVDVDLSSLRYYRGTRANILGQKVFLTRTGYTGEDGFEVCVWDVPLLKPDKAVILWNAILSAGQEFDIKPCGLGARDTLRLEAGMCLYGNDIDEETTPLEAGLDFSVKFEKKSFIGKEALLKYKTEGVKRIRVGIRALELGIPRAGNPIWSEDRKIGYLTSGTFSPVLKCGIGMGYVFPSEKQIGTKVKVECKRSFVNAVISAMPFYDETKYGRKRTQFGTKE